MTNSGSESTPSLWCRGTIPTITIMQAIATLEISPVKLPNKRFTVSATPFNLYTMNQVGLTSQILNSLIPTMACHEELIFSWVLISTQTTVGGLAPLAPLQHTRHILVGSLQEDPAQRYPRITALRASSNDDIHRKFWKIQRAPQSYLPKRAQWQDTSYRNSPSQ